MKKRIITVALLIVLTLGAFTTMALATVSKDLGLKTNVVAELQGKAAGVQLVSAASSQNDPTVRIRIRGTRALGAQASNGVVMVTSKAGQSELLKKWTNPIEWFMYTFGCTGREGQ